MEKNLFDVKGKVVVMTGACGVLGSTIVKYFAAQGCKVVLLDLERAAAIGETLVKEIEAEGGDAAFFPTNVLDKAALELNYQQIMEKYGKIDILLNAAGGNMELAMKFGEGIRVNAIAPGFLLTNQNRTLLTNEDGSLTPRSHTILAHTPIGRFLEPDELVGTLHYLASDASKAVTGTVCVVDGGFDAFSI